jgi:hypothetical protein
MEFLVAGTGQSGAPKPGPATSTDLGNPAAVAVDTFGNIYIADYNNAVIEKVTPAGTLSIVAGSGQLGPPTPGPATRSDLPYPTGVAADTVGDLYIADSSNYHVEEVTWQ